jgi:hypothetical protein
VLVDHLAAVDAAKAAPAEMEDAGDPAAVWADNQAPITGRPGVAGDSLHGSADSLSLFELVGVPLRPEAVKG